MTRQTVLRFQQQANVLWFCGHGVVARGHNVFLLPDATRRTVSLSNLRLESTLRDSDVFEALRANAQPTVFCVFDFCYSATMLNLKYYYIRGEYWRKTGDSEPSLYDDDPHLLRISVSGATDFTTAEENENGGYLTQYLLRLLTRFKKLSLDLIDRHRTPRQASMVISVNRVIDRHFYFLEINDT